MNSLYLVCLLMATALAEVPSNLRELYPFEVKCIQDNNLNAEKIQKLGHFDPMSFDDAAMLKMEECWIQELKMFDSTGKLDYSALKKAFEEYIAMLNTPEQAEEKTKMQSYYSKIDVCSLKTFEGASQAEIGIKLHNCIVKEMGLRELHPFEVKCIKDHNLDIEEIQKYRNFDIIVPVDNHAMLHLKQCWINEMNLFANGKLDYSALKKLFEDNIETLSTSSPEKARLQSYYSKIDVCSIKASEGASQAQTAIKLHNCIIEEMAM